MKQSYGRYLALGALLMVVGLAAGIYLLTTSGGSGVREVPTELQVLADPAATTTLTLTTTSSAGGRVASSTTGRSAAPTTSRPAKDANGLTLVRPTQLPKEAQQTLALVDKGGPFPYARDGVTFENREKRLPKQKSGYYREYTVVTPGSSDRGARRIISGAKGERYYTADHYASFVRLEVTG